MVVKRGCALVPSVQPVTPLPGALTIYGDAAATRVRVAPAGGAPRLFELQEAGVVQIEATPGATRIDGDDGKLVAAWVVGIDSPDYALTDDAGRFRIDELAPGTYDITILQPAATTARADGTLGASAPIVVHRTVRVASGGPPARLDVVLR